VSVEVVEQILAVFESGGAAAYLGEPVTLREHMLQTASAAARDGAGDELVVAALLHDYGHLVHGGEVDSAEHGVDTEHEEVGHRFLEAYFPPAVVEPIRLHVAAKRYLCAVDPGYLDELSPASRLSLGLQGGPMAPGEVVEFERLEHFEAACKLRRYDDVAKDPGAETPPLEYYRPLLLAALRGGERADAPAPGPSENRPADGSS
jgi:phosphonate degradation associated HDIG domain protein